MLNQNFVLLGVAIGTLRNLSYFLDTLHGKIKPNRVSFLIWSLTIAIVFFAEIRQGVGIQALMPLGIGFGTFAILLASFVNKKAYWRLNAFDFIFGGLAIIGLILWQITGVGNLAIVFSILADGFATLPTIVKAWHHPETESAWPWLAGSFNGLMALLTLPAWMFVGGGFPLYQFLITLFVFFIVQFKIGTLKKRIAEPSAF